jgi:ribosomal protein S18 acetylase RimI-like enzyme
MIEIKPLTELNPEDVHRLIVGYVSDSKYAVRRTGTASSWSFDLELVPLATPYRKRYDHLNASSIAQFQEMVAKGFSFGAFELGQLVGLAVATAEDWNKTYWVHELHVASSHQRRGIGRELVAALVAKGRAAGLRTLLCETQNTDVPAIRFYSALGFNLEGLDLSHYRNTDYPDGEIVVFMKKTLEPAPTG